MELLAIIVTDEQCKPDLSEVHGLNREGTSVSKSRIGYQRNKGGSLWGGGELSDMWHPQLGTWDEVDSFDGVDPYRSAYSYSQMHGAYGGYDGAPFSGVYGLPSLQSWTNAPSTYHYNNMVGP